ncbi:MAG: multicopper oxidase domain-containing protein [Anaerolineae bacterium]
MGYGGGDALPAMGYNGMVPGPEIRITEGDQCRFVVTNNMTQSTSIHWPGVLDANDRTASLHHRDPIKPGETFTYEFTARNAGSHMYHSHLRRSRCRAGC